MRKIKHPKAIRDLLPRDVGAGQDVPAGDDRQAQIRSRWSKCAGRAAVMSHPLLFESGRLVVYTRSAIWATELRHQQRRILSTLEPFGVTKLVVRATPAPLSPPRPPKREVTVSASSRRGIALTARHIEHAGLKAAMERLARRAAGEEGTGTGTDAGESEAGRK